MSKIAKHIVEEDSAEQTFRSVKLGMCHAMSEHGLSPKQAEEILEKLAFDPVEFLKEYTLALSLGGAGLGIGTAAIRHRFKNTVNNAESPQMRITDAKINAYKKMIANLKEEEDIKAQQELANNTGSV